MEALRRVLKGEYGSTPALQSAFRITRSRPHGHVAAVLGTLRRLGLERILDARPSAERSSPLAPAERSPTAKARAARQYTAEGWPVQSFQDWLKELATIVNNCVQPRLRTLPAFDVTTRPTPTQQHAFKLLGVKL